MIHTQQCARKASLLVTTLFFACAGALGATDERSTHGACLAPGYRQFDFWLGKWDVFEFGGTRPVAMASITAVENGCALREEYRSTTGSGGESLTMYDPRTDMWRQSWISNQGQIVLLTGMKQDRAITLTGEEYGTAAGRLIRGTWLPVNGGVRETAERSSDGGRSWTPWFDIVFKRAD